MFLLASVLDNANYIVSAGADTRVLWGCFLELVNAMACIGTPVALFPVVKRQNEAAAERCGLEALSRRPGGAGGLLT